MSKITRHLIKSPVSHCLLGATLLCLSLSSISVTASEGDSEKVASDYPDGSIEFYKEPDGGAGDGKLQCVLRFVSGTYSFRYDDNACKGKWDDITRFKVIGIPSASTFTLFDDERCNPRDDQAFIFGLKSVKNPTTTNISVPIKTLGAINAGQLVPATTLRMELNKFKRDPRDLLGCVRIERSEVPSPLP